MCKKKTETAQKDGSNQTPHCFWGTFVVVYVVFFPPPAEVSLLSREDVSCVFYKSIYNVDRDVL